MRSASSEPCEAPPRVLVTEAAAALVRQLRDQYGPLLFHQSGGCCEGSAPMCLRRDGFRIAARDVLLGAIEGCPFYVSAAQFPYWAHSQLTIDVVPDGGDSFSLEAAEGVRFITRSRVFTDTEMDALDAINTSPAQSAGEVGEGNEPGEGAACGT